MADPIPEMETPQVVHLGKNSTCCRGTCFINAEPGRCVLTILMINIPVAITLYITFKEIFIESFPDSESFIWQLTVLVVLYLTAMSNYCMVSTAMTDPGVVPGRRWQEYVSERYDQPKDKTDFYTWYLQLNQRVSPHIYKFTFCKTCQIF